MADATCLPRDIGQFDVVMLNSLLEHVPDWRAVVDGAVRALRRRRAHPGTTNRHHPFQGEVKHFPFYPWLPGPIRDRVSAWIMKRRRDLVNYRTFPQCTGSRSTALAVLRDAGLEVFSRLDLMQPEQMPTRAHSCAGCPPRRPGTRQAPLLPGRFLDYALRTSARALIADNIDLDQAGQKRRQELDALLIRGAETTTINDNTDLAEILRRRLFDGAAPAKVLKATAATFRSKMTGA